MMFEVVAKDGFPTLMPGDKYMVYGVRDDSNGYPHFLVYSVGLKIWVWKSAKHFKPVKKEEVKWVLISRYQYCLIN